jgi:hypothetical protein
MQNASTSLQFITVTEANYQHGKPKQHPDVRRHVMLGRRRRECIAATQEFQQRRMQDSAARPTGGSGPFSLVAEPNKSQATRQKEKRDIIENGEDCGRGTFSIGKTTSCRVAARPIRVFRRSIG